MGLGLGLALSTLTSSVRRPAAARTAGCPFQSIGLSPQRPLAHKDPAQKVQRAVQQGVQRAVQRMARQMLQAWNGRGRQVER